MSRLAELQLGRCDGNRLLSNGWIYPDASLSNGSLLFHPFRLIVAHYTSGFSDDGDNVLAHSEPIIARYKQAADLAIMLEPIYWPQIIGEAKYADREETSTAVLGEYCKQINSLVVGLDATTWEEMHKFLRIDAARLDDNHDLYLLLRLSHWARRRVLTGRIAGALWIRHIAEVIRRAFESVQGVHWLEEDRAWGPAAPGSRERIFGLGRPTDDDLKCKPYMAYHYGLFTGSAVRWYVEGETEESAIRCLLREPARLSVEIFNLQGQVGGGDAGVKLNNALGEDLALRRFSIVSFDQDVAANVKAIRSLVNKRRIVGSVIASDPDFEWANFSMEELVEVAALLDDESGLDGDLLRCGEWKGVNSGKKFNDRYRSLSEKRRPVKGVSWGKALADFARLKPLDPRTGHVRKIIEWTNKVSMGWRSDYDRHKFENRSTDV